MATEKIKEHHFKSGSDMMTSIGDVGDASIQTVRQEVEAADDNYYAGMQETRKLSTPVLDLATITGAKAYAKDIAAELNQIALVTIQMQDLIRSGKLSLVTMNNKERLTGVLAKIDDLSEFQKHQIVKYQESAYDLLVVKDAMEKKVAFDLLDDSLKSHLKSDSFFDLHNKNTNEILKIYFKTSDNDVLRNVNPVGMSEKKLKKLLGSEQVNEFKETDMAAIRLVRRQVQNREARIRLGRQLNIRKHVEVAGYYAQQVDGNVSEGIRQIATTSEIVHGAYAVGKLGIKAGVVTASIAGKYSGASAMAHRIDHYSREKVGQFKNIAKQSKSYQILGEIATTAKNKTIRSTIQH